MSYTASVSTGPGNATVPATGASFPSQSGATGVGAPSGPPSVEPFVGAAAGMSVNIAMGGMLALVAAGLAAW